MMQKQCEKLIRPSEPSGTALLCMLVCGLVFVALMGSGCEVSQDRRFQDPHTIMLDREQPYRVRLAAYQQARARWANSPLHIEKLQMLIRNPGHPADFYEMAVRDIVAYDNRTGRLFLKSQLPLLRHQQAVDPILDAVHRNGWKEFTPVLIEQAAELRANHPSRGVREMNILASLHPGKQVRDIAWGVFTNEIAPGDENVSYSGNQLASAFALAVQLGGGEGDENIIAERLMGLELGNSMVIDLQNTYKQFGVLPDTVEMVIWARSLQLTKHAAFREQAAALVAELNDEQRRGLALRHLPVLVYVSQYEPGWLKFGHAGMLRLVREAQRGLKTYDARTREDDRVRLSVTTMGDQPYADLMTIMVAHKVIHDAEMKRVLFAQAELDRQTKDTELGGLMKRVDEGVKPVGIDAVLYAPEFRDHDLAYIAPVKLIEDAYVELYHYHFHAQNHANEDYAGPGLGDLRTIANRQRFNGLVFTFIDSKTLNVDLYFEGPRVVDLGIIRQ